MSTVALQGYLEALVQEGCIPQRVIPHVLEFVRNATAKAVGLPPPNAAPCAEDSVLLTWSQQSDYLEAEVFASGAVEYFYKHRETGQTWSEDAAVNEMFSPEATHKLELCAQKVEG